MAPRDDDPWSRRARAEGYPARSVYKLQEMDERNRLFRRGMRVLDLGAAPGSWTMYAARKLGTYGDCLVLAVDLQPLDSRAKLPGVIALQADFTADATVAAIRDRGPFDLVLSDAAPNTSGNRVLDTARSEALCDAARDIAVSVLRPGGTLVVKLFQGSGVDAWVAGLRPTFGTVKRARPKAIRNASSEHYVLAIGYAAKDS